MYDVSYLFFWEETGDSPITSWWSREAFHLNAAVRPWQTAFSGGGYQLPALVTTPRPLGRRQCLSTENCYTLVQSEVGSWGNRWLVSQYRFVLRSRKLESWSFTFRPIVASAPVQLSLVYDVLSHRAVTECSWRHQLSASTVIVWLEVEGLAAGVDSRQKRKFFAVKRRSKSAVQCCWYFVINGLFVGLQPATWHDSDCATHSADRMKRILGRLILSVILSLPELEWRMIQHDCFKYSWQGKKN